MVAVAKLRKVQMRQSRFAEYRSGIESLFKDFVGEADERDFPLLASRPGGKDLLLVVTARRGLCGSYNHSIRKAVETFVAEKPGTGLIVTGASSRSYFRRRDYQVMALDLPEELGERGHCLISAARDEFLSGRVDRVSVVYDGYELSRKRGIRIIKLLPLILPDDEIQKQNRKLDAYILESGFKQNFCRLTDLYLDSFIKGILLDASAGEEFARMNAMELATGNADDLIFELTLSYNKARQEAITMELLDIVGGAAS